VIQEIVAAANVYVRGMRTVAQVVGRCAQLHVVFIDSL